MTALFWLADTIYLTWLFAAMLAVLLAAAPLMVGGRRDGGRTALVRLHRELWLFAPIGWVHLLNDTFRQAPWMLAFFVLPGLYHQFEDRLPDSYWMLPLSLAAGVLYLWGFIEMGFLRGNAGDNRFGADPLAEEKPEPHGAPWDQQRELEIVPPSASPPGGMHVKRGS